MTNQTAASDASAANDHDSTLAIALELSGKSWELGGRGAWPGAPPAPAA
jgi:hypothetical protein